MTPFAVATSRMGRAAVVSVCGDLDLATEPELASELDRLAQTEIEVVVVDLRELTFIDACGVRALIRARERCDRQRRRFVLVRGRPSIHRLFVLCDFQRVFEIVKHPDQAIRSAVRPAQGFAGNLGSGEAG